MAENVKDVNKEINWKLFPLMNIVYILKNFLNGVLFVFIKFPKIIFEAISYRINWLYSKINPNAGITKPGDEKGPKVYKYSAKQLEKLEKLREELLKELADPNQVRSKVKIMYMYIAKNPEGKIVHDTMSAFSKADVNAYLVSEGYYVYCIRTSDAINFVHGSSSLFSPKLSVKELIFWLTQLSTYLKAGITLSEAVKILSKQMAKKSKAKQKALQQLSYELSIGQTFSAAMERQGNMFPGLLINMIRAAEAAGSLEETLDDMADYYTEIDKTKKQMVSAMMYPSIVTVFALAVITFIIVWVIPQFTAIYEASNLKVPGITAFIISLSNFIRKRGLLLLLIIVAAIFLLVIMYKYIKPFRAFVQTIAMRLPVLGNIIIYNEITIFTKTFASLLKNNVFITNSMEILSKITNNEIYKSIMAKTINNIVKGNKISDSFKDQWAIPDVAYYMIVTGEDTGELAEMMQKVSEYYQEMHRSVVNNLKAFIEPLMIAFLAVVVGGIILAVIIPMFGMYDAI